MTAAQLPTGRLIAVELVKEMEARLYPLVYRVLAPSVYHVYLHPEDYREIEAVTPIIVLDAQRALNARVDERNAPSRWSSIVKGKRPPIEVPPGGWELYIHPDANGEIKRGELGIVSRLSLPPAPRFEGGTPTTRIVRTVVAGDERKSSASEAVDDQKDGPGPPAGLSPAPSVSTSGTAGPDAAGSPLPRKEGGPSGSPAGLRPTSIDEPAMDTQRPAAPPPPPLPTEAVPVHDRSLDAPRHFARLTYSDDGGAHVFIMRKDQISIGRGGSAHWVDVQVVTGARVSRDHCRIRRDSDGRFFLQDVSTWGTSVNGQRVAPYARSGSDGQIEEQGSEHELGRSARIQLADAVVIDFTVS